MKKYVFYIKEISYEYDICPEILFSIILIETINRRSFLTRNVECITCKLFPKLMIRKNISIGIAQIKIKTAKKILPNADDHEIMNLLLDDFNNIKICAKLIANYLEIINCSQCSFNTRMLNLVKVYLTGDINSPNYPWINLYKDLLVWSINSNLFNKTFNTYLTLT